MYSDAKSCAGGWSLERSFEKMEMRAENILSEGVIEERWQHMRGERAKVAVGGERGEVVEGRWQNMWR